MASTREYENFTPLLLQARLIGNERGEEGRKFETEAVDVVRAFTTHKIGLVGAEDEQAAREMRLGSAGTLLEASVSGTGRCREDVGDTPSGTGAIESRAAWAQERLSRCGTLGETIGV